MSSLKDQLLGLGFKPAPKPEKPAMPPRRDGANKAKPTGKPAPGTAHKNKSKPRHGNAEMDLAKAYAIRAQKEKDERIEAERLKQEEARLRREAKAKLQAFLEGKALNVADGELVRHFEYGGKIKRIYVTPDQLKALNAGAMGVLQQNGRYWLVNAAVLAEAETIFPAAVALKVDPNAPATEDPYSDPRFQVPDDLIW